MRAEVPFAFIPVVSDRPHISCGNSPDLNPVKNVWAWMKDQLDETHCKNMED
jgi:hypothetical protein